MVTASQINSYQGNAELGGVVAGDTGEASLQMFNSMLRDIGQQNYSWNVQKYQQNIKDRDASMELFAQNKMPGEIDEVDQPALKGLYDQMETLYMENPNIVQSPEAYAKMAKLSSEFQAKATAAKTRQVEFAKQRVAIAAELDPRTRDRMKAHLAAQRDAGVDHLPEPYLNELDFDLGKMFAAPGSAAAPAAGGKAGAGTSGSQSGTGMDGTPSLVATDRKIITGEDGLTYEQVTYRPDADQMLNYWSPLRYMEGNHKTLPDEAALFQQYALGSKELNDQAYLGEINANIKKFNTDNGFKPGDGKYQEDFATKGDDGLLKINDSNPIDFGRKLYVGTYWRESTSAPTLNKQAQEQRRIKAQENQANAAATNSRAQAGLAGAKTREVNELLPFKKAEYIAKANKMSPEVVAASKPFSDATNAFDKADQQTNFAPLTNFKGITPEMKKGFGIGDNAQIAMVPFSNAAAVEMFSVPKTDLVSKKTTKAKPKQIFAIRDGGETMLAAIDANGQYQVMDLNQGVNAMIDVESGFSTGAETVKLKSGAKQYANTLMGGDKPITLANVRGASSVQATPEPAAATTPAPAPNAKTSNTVFAPTSESEFDEQLLTKSGKRAWRKGDEYWAKDDTGKFVKIPTKKK